MSGKKLAAIAIFILVFGVSVFLVIKTFSSEKDSVTAPIIEGTYAVEPSLKEYYLDLGGQAVLGSAISPFFEKNGSKCQYTVNAQICFNPAKTDVGRFYLAPIGRNLPLEGGQAVASTANYGIHPNFELLYKQLNEMITVGLPLSDVKYNYEQQRIEQYFENVGFYQYFNAAADDVHLLPYGAYDYGKNCQYPTQLYDAFLPGKGISSPFTPILQRMIGNQPFGQPLTEPYFNEQGYLEQVFENAVVFAPQDDMRKLQLKNLPIILGKYQIAPIPPNPNGQNNMIFYQVADGNGFYVPIAFDEFITKNGGSEISGKPIGPVDYYDSLDYPTQCFEHYCLEYHKDAVPELSVRMSALGVVLRDMNTAEVVQETKPIIEQANIEIVEAQHQISTSEAQTINLSVFSGDGQQPIPNIQAEVTLTYPDGAQYSMHFPPTDFNGQSMVIIPSIPNVSNGSLVNYQVFVHLNESTTIVHNDSYLIWNYD
jgi:hypothetical protein